MLYGGPLGTYLSGLSSNSPASQNSTTASPHSSSYSGSGYTGPALRRSNSRYRQNGGTGLALSTTTPFVGTNTGGSSTTNYYYTPQVRRKYGPTETDPVKSVNRYSTRPTTKLSTSSGTAPLRGTSGSPSSSGPGASTVFHYSRWSPNKTSNTPSPSSATTTAATSGYGTSALGASASWTSDLSSATANNPVDYKRLYEAEKVATDELRSEVAKAQAETNELRVKIDRALQTRRVSGAEQRKLERRISECEEELKLLDKLRAESEKLHAEHRALDRVVSRLNREQ